MRKLVELFEVLFIAQFFLNCSVPKETYFSYKVGTYTVDSSKHFYYYDNLISYGKYLFEFKTRTVMRTDIYGDSSNPTSLTFDTIGVYLLSSTQKFFYEFDTFSLKSRVTNAGKLEDKPFGQNFNFQKNASDSNFSYSPVKKVKINNIPCFITEVRSNRGSIEDFINEKIILVKNSEFNSLYKTMGIEFPDKEYCIIGFQVSDLKHRQGFVQEIESMRPLNAKEKQICNKMVAISNLYFNSQNN